MRVLRSTLFAPDLSPGITTVVRESDLVDTVDSARVGMETFNDGIFVFTDVFEIDDRMTVEGATAEAMSRFEEEMEKNAAMLFYWNAGHLPHVAPGGTLSGSEPAPLSATTIRSVFAQLIHHPNYRDQTLIAYAEDGEEVKVTP